MGNSNQKLLNMNVDRRKKYDQAYNLIGDKIHTNPVKYIVQTLRNECWNSIDIKDVLIYLQLYNNIMEQKMYRNLELQDWISGLEDDISYSKARYSDGYY